MKLAINYTNNHSLPPQQGTYNRIHGGIEIEFLQVAQLWPFGDEFIVSNRYELLQWPRTEAD